MNLSCSDDDDDDESIVFSAAIQNQILSSFSPESHDCYYKSRRTMLLLIFSVVQTVMFQTVMCSSSYEWDLGDRLLAASLSQAEARQKKDILLTMGCCREKTKTDLLAQKKIIHPTWKERCFKTQLCPWHFHHVKGCRRGAANCSFAHSEEELRSVYAPLPQQKKQSEQIDKKKQSTTVGKNKISPGPSKLLMSSLLAAATKQPEPSSKKKTTTTLLLHPWEPAPEEDPATTESTKSTAGSAMSRGSSPEHWPSWPPGVWSMGGQAGFLS